MEKIRGYRLELKLNKTQRILCAKSAGTSRYAYNWKLANLIAQYEQAKIDQNTNKPKCKIGTSIDWHREWVLLKDELPWIRKTSKCCGQEALRDLEKAFKSFFSNKAKYPKFKKRRNRDSFRISSNVYIDNNFIQIAGIGRVPLKQKNYPILEGKSKLTQATVSRQADRWFVSFFLKEGEIPELQDLVEIQNSDILGVDLGIKELAITSDGQSFENPKAYRKYLKRLKRYQKRVSRKQKGSNNRKKAVTKLAKVHKKVSDVRNDAVHKLTTSLVKTKPKMIVFETLKPKNMSKNHKLAGAILDSSFGRIKEVLKYKCQWEGIHLVFAPQFYASSKYCSNCGWKYEKLELSDREWACENCGSEHDRDVNAALNLQYYGMWLLNKHIGESQSTESSSESYACGDERLQFISEQCSSVKQEFKIAKSSLPNFA
jgi:putative transposase